jgi:hypothetical protein
MDEKKEIARPLGGPAGRQEIVIYEEDLLHVCADCGSELQIVRPGKYQCVVCEE